MTTKERYEKLLEALDGKVSISRRVVVQTKDMDDAEFEEFLLQLQGQKSEDE